VQLLADLLQRRDPHPERGQRTYAEELLANASEPWALVEASTAPYAAKDKLKHGGWRWSSIKRTWWTLVRHDGLADLVAWLGREVYRGVPRHVVHSNIDPLSPDFRASHQLD
jgi:hypothetical protein